ncbi:MAG: nlp/p60 protein [Bacteroidales bacterium]
MKKYALLFIMVSFLPFSCKTPQQTVETLPPPETPIVVAEPVVKPPVAEEKPVWEEEMVVEYAGRQATEIIEYAAMFNGTPYRMGGVTPAGFDCAGFAGFVFRKFGYELPRTSAAQGETGDAVEPAEIKPGDLVFFTGRNKSNRKVGHVGICTESNGGNDFRFIHASVLRGVMVNHIRDAYYAERFLWARRILPSQSGTISSPQVKN